MALRKTRREAAVKGCRRVTSMVVGDSSGSASSSGDGEMLSSGDGGSEEVESSENDEEFR